MSEHLSPIIQGSKAGLVEENLFFYDSKVWTFTLACYFPPDSRYYDVR